MVEGQFNQLHVCLISVKPTTFIEKEILHLIYPSGLWICSLPSAFVCDLKGIILRSTKYRISPSQFSLAWIHTPGSKTLLCFVTANRNPRDILQTPQNDRRAWSKLFPKWMMIYSSLRINSVSGNWPQRGQNRLWLAKNNCRWRLTIGIHIYRVNCFAWERTQ